MINPQEIRRWFDVFHFDGDVTEIRLLGKGSNKTLSGYFVNAESIVNALMQFQEGYGIYSPINEIKSACYGKSQSEQLIVSKSTTSDSDIHGRRWILIDLDPKRPADTNSTDTEKAAAYSLMKRVATYLRDQGFKSPVYADSANGYHLYYRVNLANTQENLELVRDFLLAMELMFGNDAVDIDTAVFNAARISKVMGTSSVKGASTAERPQRMSGFLQIPDNIEPTDIAFIRKVANMYPKPERPSRENGYRTECFDLDAFIKEHNIEIAKRVTFGQGEKIILKECPFDSNHKAPDAALFRLNSGAIGFKCLHNSCSHYTWRDFRLHFDPQAYDRKTYEESRSRHEYYGKAKPQPQIAPETDEKGKKWLSMSDIKYRDPSEGIHIPTGIEKLDNKIMGLALGDLTIISGLSGAGKTSLIDFILLNAAQRNYKSVVWSGEMQDFRFQAWLDQMAAGPGFVVQKPGYDNWWYVKPEIAKEINAWLGDRITLFNNAYGNKFSQLFADIKEQVERTGAKLVICDNLMAMNLDAYSGEKNDRQSEFVTDLKNFAKEKDIHIILVCHPRKEQGFQFLRKESIAGTADLTNTADNVFIIHRVGRDFEARGKAFFDDSTLAQMRGYGNVVEVCKHRTTGLTDFLVGLYFDIPSRRFKNEMAENIIYGWRKDELPPDNTMPPVVDEFEGDTYARPGSFAMPLPEADNNEELDDLPF